MFGIWPFSSSDDPSNDQSDGTSLLTIYFNQAKAYPTFSFDTPDTFIASLEAKVPGFAANLGELVRMNSASTTLSDAGARMRDLADKSQGTANVGALTMAAGGNGQTVNWAQAIPTIATDTAVDLAKTAGAIAQSVGTGVIGTLNMAKYLPIFVAAAGAWYLYNKMPRKKS